DLEEIFEIADRIAVISHGRLTEMLPADQLTAEQIGIWMSDQDTAADRSGKVAQADSELGAAGHA
ncbi:MAG: ABC transporter ATP-binding protein, partial [Hyphomicrobiaceae bacterium]